MISKAHRPYSSGGFSETLVNGMKLKNELYRRCLSQKELAKAARVSKATVSGIVTGVRSPSPRVRRQIAEALQVSPQVLFPMRRP
jgi:transcriptional regulator with XRE-family HTH domain